jgi:hypothetical protein
MTRAELYREIFADVGERLRTSRCATLVFRGAANPERCDRELRPDGDPVYCDQHRASALRHTFGPRRYR